MNISLDVFGRPAVVLEDGHIRNVEMFVVMMNSEPETVVFGEEKDAEAVRDVLREAYNIEFRRNTGRKSTAFWNVVRMEVYKS